MGRTSSPDNDHLLLGECQGLSPDGCCGETNNYSQQLCWVAEHLPLRRDTRTLGEPLGTENSLSLTSKCPDQKAGDAKWARGRERGGSISDLLCDLGCLVCPKMPENERCPLQW